MRLVISVVCVLVLFSYAGEIHSFITICLFNLFQLHIYVHSTNFINVFFFALVAYDPLDPNGNITIKWDIMSWTPDGYVVSSNCIATCIIFHKPLEIYIKIYRVQPD